MENIWIDKMKKYLFRPSKIRGIKRKTIPSMGGEKYLSKAKEMAEEIDAINRRRISIGELLRKIGNVQ